MLDVARAAHLETNRLPADVEPGSRPRLTIDPGTFAAGAQAAVVEVVDPPTGTIQTLRYACVEDMLGHQSAHRPRRDLGAIAQGIGGALSSISSTTPRASS